MSALWDRWVAWTGREVDARPLIWLRICLPLALVGDLIDMLVRGADRAMLYSVADGGLNGRVGDWYAFSAWPGAGYGLIAVSVLALLLVAVGRLTRPAIVVAVLAYSQLGHLYPHGDRAIDHIARTVLLILLVSPVSARDVGRTVTGWTEDLIRFLLVMIYFDAGVAKISSSETWFFWHPSPELYRILASPVEGHLDPATWSAWPLPFFVAGWVTVIAEITAPVILWRRWAPWWAFFGAAIHLGIAFTMKLGVFSWGMLAFYPLLFGSWILGWLDGGRTEPG